MARSFFNLVLLGILATSVAMGQNSPAFNDAKRSLDRKIKSKSLEERRLAVANLAATGDVRAVKVLMTSIHMAQKRQARARKKVEPLLNQGGKLAVELDKKFRGGKLPSAGTVNHLAKKRMELDAKVQPKYDAWLLEYETREALLAGLGNLITSLSTTDCAREVDTILSNFQKLKSRKFPDRAIYLDILSHIHTQHSVAALVSIIMDDLDPEARVAALNAVSSIGSARAGKAAAHALEDDYWQVRAAATEALRTCATLDAIPALITRLEKEDGRLKGDVIQTLVQTTGVTFHDNATLWNAWWGKNEKKFRNIMEDLESENAVRRDNGMARAADAGFLMAIRPLLQRFDLTTLKPLPKATPARADAEDQSLPSPGGKNAGGSGGEDEEKNRALTMIGEAIGSRDIEIRESTFNAMILLAFQGTQDHQKRLDLLKIMGEIPCESARRTLARWIVRPMRGPHRNGPRRKDRLEELLAGIKSLGKIGGKNEVPYLAVWLSGDELPVPKISEAAIRALGSIELSEAARALVAGLDTLEQGGLEYSASAAICVEELGKLTGATPGADYASWRDWWTNKPENFKTDRERRQEEGEITTRDELDSGGTRFYGINTYSKRLLYVLDVSGSMENDRTESGTKKITEAKKELLQSITSLPKGATFNIIFYASSYKIWKKNMVTVSPETKKEARNWIASVKAIGATNIYDPLVKAFEMAGRGSYDKRYKVALDTIFFLSDGAPNQGRVTNPRDILREILSFNELKRVQIHSIGVGRAHNEAFMRRLAEGTGGTYISRR